MSRVPSFATADPFDKMTAKEPCTLQNLVAGAWHDHDGTCDDVVDPMNGDVIVRVPETTDFAPFIAGLESCPKSGLHNPLKNPDRYVMLGAVCARAAALLAQKEVEDYFAKLIQRVMPKSWNQCLGEVIVTRIFLENFAGDGVRFLARGFSNPGQSYRPGVTWLSLAVRARRHYRALQFPTGNPGAAADRCARHGQQAARQGRNKSQRGIRAIRETAYPRRAAAVGPRPDTLPWHNDGPAHRAGQEQHTPRPVHGLQCSRGAPFCSNAGRRAHRGCRFRLESHRSGFPRRLGGLRRLAVR